MTALVKDLTVFASNVYNTCGNNNVYQCQNGTSVLIGTIPGQSCFSP